MKRQPIAQEPSQQPSQPSEAATPPLSKWVKSRPVFGAKAVSEIITHVDSGIKILVVTSLAKGSKPRRFPIAAIDKTATLAPPADEEPELIKIMEIVAASNRVVLLPRDQQAQQHPGDHDHESTALP